MNRVKTHFNEIAKDYDYYKNKQKFYYEKLKSLVASYIPKNKKVFEVGCGTGDVLVSLKPKYGYGMDLSSAMVKIASKKHSEITFSTKFPLEKFDYIFMCDVVEHLEDPQETLNKISDRLTPSGIFINTMANPIWEPLLIFWEKMGWKMPEGPHNRIGYNDLKIMIEKSGMKVVEHNYKLLIPVNIPFVTKFMNTYLEKYLKKLCFVELLVCENNHLE